VGSTNLHLVLDQNKLMADLALVPRAAPPAPSPARADTVVADSMNARVAHADTLWLASGNDSLPPPVAVDSCKPVRPDSARSQGVFGRVTVDVLVDTDGRVIEANVVHGIAALNEAALDCARKFRFEPYHWRGRNVRFWHELPMTFLLD
jgi:TonB family protein